MITFMVIQKKLSMNLEKSSQKQCQTILNKISQRYIKGQRHVILSVDKGIINTN